MGERHTFGLVSLTAFRSTRPSRVHLWYVYCHCLVQRVCSDVPERIQAIMRLETRQWYTVFMELGLDIEFPNHTTDTIYTVYYRLLWYKIVHRWCYMRVHQPTWSITDRFCQPDRNGGGRKHGVTHVQYVSRTDQPE